MALVDVVVSVPNVFLVAGAGVVVFILTFWLLWQWQRRKKTFLTAPPAPPQKPDSGVKKTLSSWKQKSVLPLEQELAHINSELQILPQVEFSPGRTITSLPSKSALSSSFSRKAFSLPSFAPPAVRPLTQQSSPSSPATISPELSKIEQQLARLNGTSLPIPPAPKIPQMNGVLSTPPPVSQADKKTILQRKEALLVPPASLKRKAESKEAERKVRLLPLKISSPVKGTRMLSGGVASGMSEKKLSFFQRLFTRRPPETASSAKSIVPQALTAAKGSKVKESVMPKNTLTRSSIPESPMRETKPKEVSTPILKKQAVPTPSAPTPSSFFKKFLNGTPPLRTISQKASSKQEFTEKMLPKSSSPKVPLPKPTLSKPATSAATVKTPLSGSSEKDQLARLQEGINQLKKRIESA